MSYISLPIELINFNAELNKSETVDLTWQTDSERENDYFTIEKSVDAKEWTFVGKVNGAGTTAQAQNYYLEDKTPSLGTNYYRLKQTDFNGIAKEVDIKSVFLAKKDEFIIFPNPSSNEFTIFGLNKQIDNIEIFDNVGKNVTFNYMKKSINEMAIEGDNLANGIYYIRLISGDKENILKHTINK